MACVSRYLRLPLSHRGLLQNHHTQRPLALLQSRPWRSHNPHRSWSRSGRQPLLQPRKPSLTSAHCPDIKIPKTDYPFHPLVQILQLPPPAHRPRCCRPNPHPSHPRHPSPPHLQSQAKSHDHGLDPSFPGPRRHARRARERLPRFQPRAVKPP